jgi:excisionase family DNA binding protein
MNEQQHKATQLLTADEVARIFKVSKGHIYNLASRKKLPAVRVFGALRFDVDEIEKLIEQGRMSTRQQIEQINKHRGER